MIEIEMAKDIRDFQSKVLGPFTARQLVCIGISLCYGIPIILLSPSLQECTMYIIIASILMAPVISCGFVNAYGLPLEKFAVVLLKTLFLTPRKRKYTSENTFDQFKEKSATQQQKVKITYLKDEPPLK